MKNLKKLSALLLSLLLFTACSKNSNLTHENAEKAIRKLVAMNNTSGTSKFNISEELTIDPLTQTSETEASCWAKTNATVTESGSDSSKAGKKSIETGMNIEFQFQKNSENNWILWGISRSSTQARTNQKDWEEFMNQNRNLSIIVD